MSRLIFFFQEALRALRRNGAPSLAAIVTTVVTVVLLGVLIPIFQTAQAQERTKSATSSTSSTRSTPTRRQAEMDAAARRSWKRSRTSPKSTSSPKQEALTTLRGELKDKSIVEQLHYNPLPASFEVKADDAANLAAIRAAVYPDGPKGKAISPVISKEFDRQQSSAKIEQVTSALKIVLTVITVLLVLASLMLIGNTIRLSIYTRRREVEVMRLVGATRWFIRWPFMIEGVVVGFIGGAGRHTCPVDRQDHDRRPAEQHVQLPRGAEQQHPRLPGDGGDSLRRRGPGLDARLGRHLRRFLKV